ncbi:pentapeptide repeat-containing protein [Streptomyces sp. NPDC046909]|uniref:pentapeptide repeat-containing protein n=1 Tax=Streptomyces sp. NPDC046909 TaxID=3155617 RepID=UPI0033DA5979
MEPLPHEHPTGASPSAPSWSHCAHGADPATDSVGCRGIHVPGHTACLAHLAEPDRTAYLTGLTPGADVDHRGTSFSRGLLTALLDGVRDPTTGNPHFGKALFTEARFSGAAWFRGAQFSGLAHFSGAHFRRRAEFRDARFSGDACFGREEIGPALFSGAQFSDRANFSGARFSGRAKFDEAQFSRDASFGTNPWSGDTRDSDGAQFSGHASFARTRFFGHAEFGEAQFSSSAGFGLAEFSGQAAFGGAQFASVWFAAARFLEEAYFGRAKFSGHATFAAQFNGDAVFDWAQFSGDVQFGGAQFSGIAKFDLVRFEGASSFGPVLSARGGLTVRHGVHGAGDAGDSSAARDLRAHPVGIDGDHPPALRGSGSHPRGAVRPCSRHRSPRPLLPLRLAD